MTDIEIPWSIPVRIEDIGKGYSRRLVADEAARARIAAALDLESLESLEAQLDIQPKFEGGFVTGRLSARVEQICGVSLDPFFNEVESEFELRFTTRAPEPPAPGEELSLADLDAPEYIESAVLDLGALVVEELALAIDPFPRKPGAVFEAPEPVAEPSPFAALASLKREKPTG